MSSKADALRRRHGDLYGGSCRIYRAPGRVNLIGEHTDYNDGFVMPVAIDSYVWVAISPRPDSRLAIYSENFSQSIELDLAQIASRPAKRWSDYVHGVALLLARAGHRLRGANLLIAGDVPIGSGLSSSAAIEVAAGYALLENSDITPDRVELAKVCRQAENEFVGARVGIMDPFISCCGRAAHALLLDCRSLEYRLLPLPAEASLVICNTMVKHEHASGEYNRRRMECEEAVRILSRSLAAISALRDVTVTELERSANQLPEVLYRRCRHVISENVRVAEAAVALESGNLDKFGDQMNASHASLRLDYEVSCQELDLMVDLARSQPGVYGARMTGGGFGGCTVNLVKAEHAVHFRRALATEYEQATGLRPEIFITSAAEGAGELAG